jgi:hypothetical protein
MRVRSLFAWFPVTIPVYKDGYNKNIRPIAFKNVWMERVTVIEEFMWAGITEPRLEWKIIEEAKQ